MKTCDGLEDASQPGTKARKGVCFHINNHNIVFRSRLLKCFYISTEGAHDPGELCRYGYNRQAKGESESRGSHLNPNPRTNKATRKIGTEKLTLLIYIYCVVRSGLGTFFCKKDETAFKEIV